MRRWGAIAASSVALALVAACGGNAEPSGKDWTKTDVCSLIGGEEIATYLGGKQPHGERTDTNGRPTCLWKADDFHKFELTVWRPPVPDVFKDKPRRILDVAGKKGYVTSGTAISCDLDVEADPAWVGGDVDAQPGPGIDLNNENGTCDKLAGTLKSVFTKLGW